jgi:RNA polymerase sigma-70 factor (ECF subfamily)
VFLEAFRSAGRFRRGSSVAVWLFGIAVNVVRHHVRSTTRRRLALLRAAAEPLATVPTPDVTAERRELLGRLQAAVATLPYDLRAAFVLCDVEGVPGPQAARTLGLRPGTLGRRLHEARRALREALTRRTP